MLQTRTGNEILPCQLDRQILLVEDLLKDSRLTTLGTRGRGPPASIAPRLREGRSSTSNDQRAASKSI